jgi:OmpA family protein
MRIYHIAWLGLVAAFVSAPALAATYIYPTKGQSKAQQNKDKGECTVWATDQTGFDPANPPPAPKAPPPPSVPADPTQSGLREHPNAVRGAGRGAALGAIGGAIAGDAGKGAAAGAAIGGVGGAIRRRDMQRDYQQQVNAQQQQYQQQVNAQRQQHEAEVRSMRGEYNKAFGACMEARGYSVK